MPREWYIYGDRKADALEKKIRKEFNQSRLTLNFDELNVRSVSKEATRLYKRLESLNRDYLLDVAENAYKEVCEDEEKPAKKKLGTKWLLAFLALYDPVTRYVYEHEVERKRARFFEAFVADLQAGNRRGILDDYKTAMNAWIRQTRQYMTNAEDAAVIQAFKDTGVKKVRWIAEKDDRTCKICRNMDGNIYPITDVPDKVHYNCRCTVEAVRDGD